MITYEFIKENGTKWWYFYDRSIRLWTVFEVDVNGYQISPEADYYHDKTQMNDVHKFDFKNKLK